MNKNIIIAILVLVILGGIGVYGFNYIADTNYEYGFNDATLLINQQLLDNLNQNGYIPYVYPINETDSVNLKLVPQLYEKGGEE